MKAFPLSLSSTVIGRKIEQRFGLIGIARLLKLAELVVSRADPQSKQFVGVIAWGDFNAALQFSQQESLDFLAFCDHARVVDRGRDGERLRLTLVGELATLLADQPVSIEPCTLFRSEQQWADWFASDLNCPPYLRNDPATRRLFRHWCASNVTVDEIEAAAVRATNAGEAPHPAVLHDQIKAMRLEKIRAAG